MDAQVFEALLSERYNAILRDHVYQPLMIKGHGISGPSLARNAGQYRFIMLETQDALDALGYRTCLCYGTLLGAIREKALIAHDDDVDIGG